MHHLVKKTKEGSPIICKTKYGIIVQLTESIGNGGEGTIWKTNTGKVAKIYKKEVLEKDKDLRNKIEYMCSDQPSKWVIEHTAWPKEPLYDDSDNFVGFLMDDFGSFTGVRKMYSYYQSGYYPDKTPVNHLHKVAVAAVLARLVEEMHSMGRIIGDFNPKNIGYKIIQNSNIPVNIVFFDTDSFPIKTHDGRTFKCKVAYPGFTAPETFHARDAKKEELLSRGIDRKVLWADLDDAFNEDTDNFALGVHIFQLLMNGFHPYTGVSETNAQKAMANVSAADGPSKHTVDKTADLNKAVILNQYCMRPGWRHDNAACLVRNDYPEYITSLFDKTFRDLKPGEHRPEAREWSTALARYLSEVKPCKDNYCHIYWKNLSYCPYCEAKKRCHNKLYNGGNNTASNNTATKTVQSPQQVAQKPSNGSPLENAKFIRINGKRKIE